MKMLKWNNEKGEYEPYEVPADWQCRLAEEDMDKIVNCASCGKEIERRLERARDKGEI